MKRIITAAALAAILAIATACGGDDGNGGQENLHPVLPNHIYLQIQEGREYVSCGRTSPQSAALSDRINALHQGGYEIEHTTSDSFGNSSSSSGRFLARKSLCSPTARHPQTDLSGQT